MFDDTWARFRALEQTSGPAANAIDEWRRGRERYAVWALRVIDPAVTARMSAVAERLGDSLVRVRSEDAHVTAWVCGFPAAVPTLDDDVADAILDAQRAAVSRLPPPRLSVGAPNAFATCAFLEVHDPHGDLAALRTALAVPGAKEVRFARYQPHVTVGRFGDSRPVAPIARALAALREGERVAPQPRSRRPCRADRAGRARARSTNDRLVSAVMISADGPPRDLGRRVSVSP